MSPDRCHRLWRQAGLQVPRRRPRRRVAGSRERPLPPAAKNHVWAYDFIFDACANGQKLKCLTIVDEYTRECLAIDVAGSIRSSRVLEQLAKLISIHGAPRYLRCDNGPEFVSKAILEWIVDAGIHTAHIDPGKPWQNGTDESFNGKTPRRVLVDGVVSITRRGKGHHRTMAAALQRGAPAFQSRLQNTERVQGDPETFNQPGSCFLEPTGPRKAGRSNRRKAPYEKVGFGRKRLLEASNYARRATLTHCFFPFRPGWGPDCIRLSLIASRCQFDAMQKGDRWYPNCGKPYNVDFCGFGCTSLEFGYRPSAH